MRSRWVFKRSLVEAALFTGIQSLTLFPALRAWLSYYMLQEIRKIGININMRHLHLWWKNQVRLEFVGNHLVEWWLVMKSSFVGCTVVPQGSQLGEHSLLLSALRGTRPCPRLGQSSSTLKYRMRQGDRHTPLCGHKRSWHRTSFLHSDTKILFLHSACFKSTAKSVMSSWVSYIISVWLTFLVCIKGLITTAWPQGIMTIKHKSTC